VILSTRTVLSRRRLFLVVALLCVLVGAFAGLHAGGHDDSATVCGLAGLGCAIAAAIALSPRIAGIVRGPRAAMRSFASCDDPSRNGVVLPTALGLAALCRLRV
jgi:hypothetical protein